MMLKGLKIIATLLMSFTLLVGLGSAVSVNDCGKMEAPPTDGSIVIVEPVKVQSCYKDAAIESGNWQDCNFAPAPGICVGQLAEKLKDPQPIFDYASTAKIPYADGGEYERQQRAQLRDNLLGAYVQVTKEVSAWDKFQYGYIRDGSVLLMAASMYGATGMAPKADYCDNIKGGYSEEEELLFFSHEFEDGKNTFKEFKNLCNTMVSAIRELEYGNNACEDVLPGKLIGDLEDWEKDDAFNFCKNFDALLKSRLKEMNEKLGVPLIEEEDIAVERWVLNETKINPENLPTKITGPPVEGRYEGSIEDWGVSETSMSLHDKEVDNGYEYFDATFTANFDKPASTLIPGENITLSSTSSGGGTVNEGAGGCNTGIHFEYRADGVGLKGDTDTGLCLEFNTDTATAWFEVPSARDGSEIKIYAFLWNCGPCGVTWVYKGQKFGIPKATADEVTEYDMAALSDYFDLTPEVLASPDDEPKSDFITVEDLDKQNLNKQTPEEAPKPSGGITGTVKNILSKITSFFKRLF